MVTSWGILKYSPVLSQQLVHVHSWFNSVVHTRVAKGPEQQAYCFNASFKIGLLGTWYIFWG